MRWLGKIVFNKTVQIFVALTFILFIVCLLPLYSNIQAPNSISHDAMQNYIPDELEAQRRIKHVQHEAFFGGSASVSVYELKVKSEKYIQDNPSYLTTWYHGRNGCTSALVFLRDIGDGKDKKIRPYISSAQNMYSRDNVMLVLDKSIIITCSASW